jgi:hypothetical protein
MTNKFKVGDRVKFKEGFKKQLENRNPELDLDLDNNYEIKKIFEELDKIFLDIPILATFGRKCFELVERKIGDKWYKVEELNDDGTPIDSIITDGDSTFHISNHKNLHDYKVSIGQDLPYEKGYRFKTMSGGDSITKNEVDELYEKFDKPNFISIKYDEKTGEFEVVDIDYSKPVPPKDPVIKAGRIFDKSKCCHTNYEGMGVKKEELLKDSLILAVGREDWEECLKLINKINESSKEPRVFEFEAGIDADDKIESTLYNKTVIVLPENLQTQEFFDLLHDKKFHIIMKELIE